MSDQLLAAGESSPVSIFNPAGRSAFLLIGDHAGRAIPAKLGQLGLTETDLSRHIAWDIGVQALGKGLAERLDAVFIAQTWSRLVIDCNRDPERDDAIPESSDGSPVPGNQGLTAEQRAARIDEIHAPYQDAIADEIESRRLAGKPTVLIALHSFTPSMAGFDRPWDAGVLHDGGDLAFALAMLAAMQATPGLTIGDNEPYRMDGIDYTVPRHAFAAGLGYAELEIRQDHLVNGSGVSLWADRIAKWLREAEASVASE